MPQTSQTAKISASRRSPRDRSAFTANGLLILAVLLFAIGLGDISRSEAKMDSNSMSDDAKSSQKKKRKFSRLKRMKGSSRANASTLNSGRYLAQNDLESDLEAELESESQAADDTPVSEAAPLPMTQQTAAPQVGEDVQITDIKYDSKQSGGTVIVTTTSPATYRTREVPANNQVIVEIANAKLPEKLKRPFNTKDFKQATVSIMAYQEPGSSTARIVLQYRQPRSVEVKQSEQVLSIVAGAAKTLDSATDTTSGEGLGETATNQVVNLQPATRITIRT